MAKPKLAGNQNARKGEHSSLVMRLDVPTVDLIYEVLALEGFQNPTSDDVIEAAKMEIQMAFARRKGDEQAQAL